ncbi:acyl-CoA ligase (AMP-forming), exosortase A system-associated [Pseudomaricurvus sp. HS19]|uniref:acyl-CoA ligase (AMP-forming), exosortase A system-associated n=1 Tax=Pseudomaricurvus sp. HS19 TaxID=2692626 RepID=UPI00136F7F99|nr:acyl-CoA ligase (AMP-forming), exosortase A system-associated [Pseudomaricurvus sp. HS19]MYM62052.1 acyl-CoA ligase (AMP-forming), exosortase A system-associated [Pseudomaricurvus sp. HS19]
MPQQLYQLIETSARKFPHNPALLFKDQHYTYQQLWQQVTATAGALQSIDLGANDRLAIYLPKIPEAVFSYFGGNLAGGVFVPVNALLKAPQVQHILTDCNVKVLVTSSDRLSALAESLLQCPDLQTIIYTGRPLDEGLAQQLDRFRLLAWGDLPATEPQPRRRIDTDMAAILYTSGSTGKPKGVVLSNRNMLCGAESVSQYLHNTPADRLLAVLPFSFDYGLSQLTTAFRTGAQVVLMDYLLPRDVLKAVVRYGITGLAAVPPLWNQLANLEWPQEARDTLRYLTNSGGAMPKATTSKLRQQLPATTLYLMYGLTEAFRSTYLPPEQLDNRPDSIGKAIPNAEILVVREDGTPCAPHEPGELVHKGSLVAMGYWNDPVKTAERFKPAPGQLPELPVTEIAVWSGDQAYCDEEGFIYFVSRKDEMIKTSGYRVSPTELEEVLHQSGLVDEVAALGAPHPELGEAIVVVAASGRASEEDIRQLCMRELPSYMQPRAIEMVSEFPKNPNGKLDRNALKQAYSSLFTAAAEQQVCE